MHTWTIISQNFNAFYEKFNDTTYIFLPEDFTPAMTSW